MFHSPDVARNVQGDGPSALMAPAELMNWSMEGSFHFTSVARLWAVRVSSTYLE